VTELINNLQVFVNKDFEGGLSKGFDPYLELFSSMLSSTELYLSNNLSNIKNKPGNLLKRTRNNIVKLLTKPTDGIERLLENTQSKGMETAQASKKNTMETLKYSSQAKKVSMSKVLKSLYANFMSFTDYGKKAYESTENSAKKIVGNVKITIFKLIKLGEYVMTRLSPQWNKVLSSPQDMDFFSPEMSQQNSIDPELAKYETGYSFLKYKD